MSEKTQAVIAATVLAVLRPLIRVLLRHSVPFGVFAELARQAYVQVAAEFTLDGRKQTHSRIAVLTGLTRKEVARLQDQDSLDAAATNERFHRCTRVLSGWMRDPEFLDAQGIPRSLPLDGEGASFTNLVQRYSGDMPVRAVADELLRTGAIARDEQGVFTLVSNHFVPKAGQAEQFAILGADVADLIGTIDHNMTHAAAESRFQLKVSYDNINADDAAAFRMLADEQSMNLLRAFDRHLAEHDRDAHPERAGAGRHRVGVGIYYFENDVDDRSSSKDDAKSGREK